MNDVVNLFLSFIAIVFASWCIGEGGDILGKKYDASIVGGLVIAWLNTAPETIFFLFSLEGRNPHFAIGAVSGSTVVVSTIALGVCIYFGSLRRTNKYFYLINSVKQQCFILLSSGLIPITIAIVGYNYIIAIFGAFCYMCFVFYELLKSKNSETPKITSDGDVEQGGIEPLDESSDDSEPTWKGVMFLFVGGGFIFLFSDNFISSSVSIAKALNVNAILLSFFLAPIASEMPEILESISLARKGSIQSLNVAFSNLVGGTISKTTLLCGIFAYYGINKELPWEAPNFSVSLILLSTSAVTAACIGYFIAKLRSHHSYILFLLFIVSGIIQFFLNADMHLSINKDKINA